MRAELAAGEREVEGGVGEGRIELQGLLEPRRGRRVVAVPGEIDPGVVLAGRAEAAFETRDVARAEGSMPFDRASSSAREGSP